MTEGMPHSELFSRAFQWILTERAQEPHKKLANLVDEAGMRFNLTPNDSEVLLDLLKKEQGAAKQ